jgi:hypothetical protein
MADSFSVEIEGLKEVDEKLTLLGAVAGEKVVRSTLFQAAKPTMESTRAAATSIQRSGALAKAIRRVYVRDPETRGRSALAGGSRFVVAVAPKAKDQVAVALANLVYRRKRPIRGVYWGHFVEWGFTVWRTGRKVAGRGIFTAVGRAKAADAIAIFDRLIRRNVDRALRRQKSE